MTTEVTITSKLAFRRGRKGARVATDELESSLGDRKSVPRPARLLALAHRIEALVAVGTIRDYAEVARLGQVTRARVTQIMNFLSLAPDIQEQLLDSEDNRERKRLSERQIRKVLSSLDWGKQRRMFRRLFASEHGTRSVSGIANNSL